MTKIHEYYKFFKKENIFSFLLSYILIQKIIIMYTTRNLAFHNDIRGRIVFPNTFPYYPFLL